MEDSAEPVSSAYLEVDDFDWIRDGAWWSLWVPKIGPPMLSWCYPDPDHHHLSERSTWFDQKLNCRDWCRFVAAGQALCLSFGALRGADQISRSRGTMVRPQGAAVLRACSYAPERTVRI
ncbi:hypothetical protein ACIBHX_23210 [Nonomuraea sp. NPDC050536]|uniref:hypothetical protein n=1 Tax=Nonomuraea sp. NPDC050536 TaxID=3364366 RepID=UPI0037CBDEA7